MSYNVKEKSQSWFGWLDNLLKLTNKDKSKNKETSSSRWFQILKWRIKWLFFPGKFGGFKNAWVFFYKTYEPKWLANLTCPSTSLLSQVENTIQKTIEEDELIVGWKKDSEFIEGGYVEHKIVFIHNDYINEVSESYKKKFLKKLIRNIWDIKSKKLTSRFMWNENGVACIYGAFIGSYLRSLLDTDSVEFQTNEQWTEYQRNMREYWEGGDDDYTS